MIPRRVQPAAGEIHDLVVVGGGIYGTMLTLEAARRGLRPLLLERSDFGAETSANSLRIIHGGLRYLQSLDLRRFRESVRERSWWLATFPDLVRPLPCLMPLYGEGLRRPAVFRAALRLDRLLGRLLDGGAVGSVPPGRVLGRDDTEARLERVLRTGLRGAALWYDAVVEDSERLVVESLRWACALGGTALNYVRAEDLLVAGGRVAGVRAVDRVTGRTHEFRARHVIVAAGPWTRQLAGRFDRDHPGLWRPTLAFNLAIRTDRAPRAALAVVPRPAGEPTYFLVPWKEGLLAGTQHVTPAEGRRHGPTEAEVGSFKRELARAAPGIVAEEDSVARVYWGWLPGDPSRRLGLATAPKILHHGRAGGPEGLTSVVGVKLTTSRAVARQVLRQVTGRRLPTASGARPVPSRPIDEVRRDISGHGWYAPDVLETLSTLVREEAVVTPEDLVARRLAWGPFDEPPDLHELAGRLGLGPVRPDDAPGP